MSCLFSQQACIGPNSVARPEGMPLHLPHLGARLGLAYLGQVLPWQCFVRQELADRLGHTALVLQGRHRAVLGNA